MSLRKTIREHYSRLPWWKKAPLRVARLGVLFSVFMVASQSAQIFPGALASLISGKTENRKLPQGVESIFVDTADGETLEAWRLDVVPKCGESGANFDPKPDSSGSEKHERSTASITECTHSRKTAIVFHGNGGDVQNFFVYQQYFQRIGVRSYGFDYRGFGNSSGWPSEEGLYRDADAIVEYVKSREQLTADDLVLVGISVGTGPAAYAAAKHGVGALVLFSPFRSLLQLVKEMTFVGFLHPFLLFEFPVEQYVAALERTCLVVVHGKVDTVIPFSHGEQVAAAYQGTRASAFLPSESAGHNDILFKTATALPPILAQCDIRD
ncbi:MAG: alpha/beta fold hydrolase [Bdellovibrionales bacterium]|nr:alpha/beta fold hydrolase [Bdellovibrionales bacterium]